MFSLEQRQDIIARRHARETIQEIATYYHVRRPKIVDVLAPLGLNHTIRRAPTNQWTDENVTELTTLWLSGVKGDAIEAHFGGRFTAKQIYSKVRTLGLPKHKVVVQATPHQRPPAGRLCDVATLSDEPEFLGTIGETVDDGFCKWMHGDVLQHTHQCCGHAAPNGPYCEYHERRAWTIPPPRRAMPQPFKFTPFNGLSRAA